MYFVAKLNKMKYGISIVGFPDDRGLFGMSGYTGIIGQWPGNGKLSKWAIHKTSILESPQCGQHKDLAFQLLCWEGREQILLLRGSKKCRIVPGNICICKGKCCALEGLHWAFLVKAKGRVSYCMLMVGYEAHPALNCIAF